MFDYDGSFVRIIADGVAGLDHPGGMALAVHEGMRENMNNAASFPIKIKTKKKAMNVKIRPSKRGFFL